MHTKHVQYTQNFCLLLCQVINGRELSDLKSYTPSNSFNTEGSYVGTYHDISSIITEEKVVNKEIEKQQELEEVCIFNLPSTFQVEFLQKVQETLFEI